jgi:hypothetical protein
MTSDSILIRVDAPTSNLAVVLEDDGKVAYAYLLRDEKIVGDVWLYNVAPTPEDVDWTDRAQLPFLNPRRFCQEGFFPRLTADAAVSCEWQENSVDVALNEEVVARIMVGEKPGRSKLAAGHGPLARPLEKTT